MISICFVCLGNICRSPTAEGIMLHLVEREGLSSQIHVDSAGTAAYHLGEPADRRSARAAEARGVELPSRARQFKREDFDRFDYVLCMDSSNLREISTLANGKEDHRIFLLRDFDPNSPKGSSVPDPYYGGEQGFEEVLDLCFAACEDLLDHIVQEHNLQAAT